MILASDIFTDVKALLDDDNSGRYNEVKDLVPALNNAVLWLVAVFNSAFEAKKLSPEILQDLVTVKVLTVSGTNTKKADLSSITDKWTIIGVEPSPSASGGNMTETRNRMASRLTIEQWNDSLADPFSPGTGVSIPTAFVRPAYIGPGQFFGDNKPYIMIRPASAFSDTNVGIWYLRNPVKVATGASQLEFPMALHTLLVEKTLSILSLQHGKDSVYQKITDADVLRLTNLMVS